MEKVPREINIELLRICAMVLVLIVHTAYFSMGWPTQSQIIYEPFKWTYITFIQSLSVICVNVFILISGWFGIKPKLKSIVSFIFQVFFFLTFSLILMVSLGKVELNVANIFKCITVVNTMWFVWAYLLLYILSPALNALVEHTNKNILKTVLIAYFFIQFAYGWTGLLACFDGGYSTMSFIGLYLLARYIRVYRPAFATSFQSKYIMTYWGMAVLLTFLGVIIAYIPILKDHVTVLSNYLFVYNCPIVIVESCAFFLIFKYIRFTPPIEYRGIF